MRSRERSARCGSGWTSATTASSAPRSRRIVGRRSRSASGDLYRGTYEGDYCARCEAYYQPHELVAGRCPVHNLPCERVQEANWFFRLSHYQECLERLVRDTPFVQPESRRGEVLG